MGQILDEPLDRRLTRPLHRAAHGYWARLRGPDGLLPGRQDVDPLDIPDLLPWVNLVEVHRRMDRLLFRHRLVGTGIVEISGGDHTGRWLHDVPGGGRPARVHPGYEAVVRTGEPDLLLGDLADLGKPHWTLASLLLPLAWDHQRVDMLMIVTQYD